MIKLQNVSKTYENGTLAVDDVNFELPEKGMAPLLEQVVVANQLFSI